jgi:tetratricopeptide (TPR) repeat protein
VKRPRPFYPVTFLLAASLLVSASACGGPEAADHVTRGEEFKRGGLLNEAEIEFRNAVQLEPQRGEHRVRLADVYLQRRNGAAALREYIRAADLLPNDVKVQLRAGALLLLAEQFEDAQTRARNALNLEPANVDALVLLAHAKAGLKDLDGALTQYQEAVATDANDRVLAGLGAIQFARGDRVDAEANFRKAVAVAPQSVTAHLALANFLWAAQRLPEAEGELKKALELEPGNLFANRALGQFYAISGRLADAEPHFKAIAAADRTPDATVALANYYVRLKRVADGRKLLDELSKDPNSWPRAMTKLAAIDALEGFRAQGTDRLRSVLAKHPDDGAARLLLARLLLADGKREEALTEAMLVTKAATDANLGGEAQLVVGRIHAMLDHPESAIKAYEHALASQARSLAAPLALASLHLERGELDKSASYVNQAIALSPEAPEVRALRVRLLLGEGKTAEARAEVAGLQREYPNALPVLGLIAAEQLASGRTAEARQTYAKILAAAPAHVEAVNGVAQLDLAAGRPADARAVVDRALALGDRTGDLLILSALVDAAEQDWTGMEDTLRKAIALDPARLRGYGLLAALYINQNRLAEAERQFIAMVEKDPNSVANHTMLGMLLQTRGKVREAERQYERILALDSTAPVAANNLAYIYADENRNLDVALTLAQAAHRRLSSDPNVRDTLGWVYYRKGMFGPAVRELEQSARLKPKDPVVRYHLGMAYHQAGELGKARTSLREALALAGAFPGADDARKTLQSLGG